MANGFKIGPSQIDLLELVEAYGNISVNHPNIPLNANAGPASTTGAYFKLYTPPNPSTPQGYIGSSPNDANMWYPRRGSVLGGLWGSAPEVDVPMYFKGVKIPFAAKGSAPLWRSNTGYSPSFGATLSIGGNLTSNASYSILPTEKAGLDYPLVWIVNTNPGVGPSVSWEEVSSYRLLFIEVCGGGGGGGRSSGYNIVAAGGGGGGGGGAYVSLFIDLNYYERVRIVLGKRGEGATSSDDATPGGDSFVYATRGGVETLLAIARGGEKGSNGRTSGLTGYGGTRGLGGSKTGTSGTLVGVGAYLIQSSAGAHGQGGVDWQSRVAHYGDNVGDLELLGGGVINNIPSRYGDEFDYLGSRSNNRGYGTNPMGGVDGCAAGGGGGGSYLGSIYTSDLKFKTGVDEHPGTYSSFRGGGVGGVGGAAFSTTADATPGLHGLSGYCNIYISKGVYIPKE